LYDKDTISLSGLKKILPIEIIIICFKRIFSNMFHMVRFCLQLKRAILLRAVYKDVHTQGGEKFKPIVAEKTFFENYGVPVQTRGDQF